MTKYRYLSHVRTLGSSACSSRASQREHPKRKAAETNLSNSALLREMQNLDLNRRVERAILSTSDVESWRASWRISEYGRGNADESQQAKTLQSGWT